MLAAGFHDFSGEAPGDLNGFSNAEPLGHQTRHIRARGQAAALFERFYSDSDGRLFNFGKVLVTSHRVSAPQRERLLR